MAVSNPTFRRVSPAPAPRRKPRVDSTGRLDLLALRLTEELVKRAPVSVQSFYAEFRPELETEIKRALGPRNPGAAKLRKFVVDSTRILKAQEQARIAKLRGAK